MLCSVLQVLLTRILPVVLQSDQRGCSEAYKVQPHVLEGRLLQASGTVIWLVSKLKHRYGPFWLYATLIFVLGAVNNLIVYNSTPTGQFAYNYQVIAMGFSIFYLEGMGLSALIGLLFGCLGLNSTVVSIVCLYGYGMTTYIIAVLLCIINLPLLQWLFLLYAAVAKAVFILRNLFEGLEVPTSKKIAVIVVVLI